MSRLIIETALGRWVKTRRLRASTQNLGLRLDKVLLLRLINWSSLSRSLKLWLCHNLLFRLVLKGWWLTAYNFPCSWRLRSGYFHARTFWKLGRLNMSRNELYLKVISKIVNILYFFNCTLIFWGLTICVQLRACIRWIHGSIILRIRHRCVLLTIACDLLDDLLWRNTNHWILCNYLCLTWGYLLLCVLLSILFVEIQ